MGGGREIEEFDDRDNWVEGMGEQWRGQENETGDSED